MADHHAGEHHLIDQYLARIRGSIGQDQDADAVVDELRDHLLASAERHVGDGADPVEAERLALAAMGAAEVVATSFAREANQRPLVATPFTRIAGIAGWVAAGSGLAAVAAFAIGDRIEEEDGYWSTASQAWGTAGSVAALATTLALLVLLTGVVRRHGGLGRFGPVALAIAGLGTLASVIVWAVPVWATIIAIGWLTASAGLRRQHVVHPRAALLVGLGLLGLAATTTAGSATELATAIGSVVSIAAVTIGTVSTARVLSAEQPVTAQVAPA